MNITMDGNHEANTSEHGTAGVDCIEFGNHDSNLKGGFLAVESADLDACLLTPKNCGTPTDLEFTVGPVHCSAVYESSDGYIGKSTCSLAVHETSLPKCEVSIEEDISSRKDDGRTGGNVSECLQSIEGGDTKEEKNSNLRPRRKSKYLSPPFIQPVKGELKKGSGDKSVQDSGKPSPVKRGKKRKQPTKPIAVSANLEEIKASSAELILQLNAAACDYLNPCSKKAFNSAKLFFTSFRASAFVGVSIEEQTRIDKTYAQKKVRTLKQKKAPLSLCDGNPSVASSSPLKVDALSSTVKPQRKRKRKVEPIVILESGKNQTTTVPDLNCVTGVPSATLDPIQVTGQGEAKSVSGLPIATLNPLQVTGQEEVKIVSAVPIATRNPLQVAGQGEVKSGVPIATLNPLQVSGQGEVQSVNGVPIATLNPLQATGQGEVRSVSGVPIATLNPLQVSGQGEVQSVNGVSIAALNPSQVTGQGEVGSVNGLPSCTLDPLQAKSVPEKKKKIRKKKTAPAMSNVKSISLEERLRESFGASTVPNSKVASPPGFLAKDSTPSKPILPPKLEPNGGTNSSSGMSLDQMKQSLEFMTSMLEKSGDMISPAMRANLEKEIKNLLKKVDPMISSSS